ncbi:hypothetical protein [Streptomyces hiroshimensis]
MQVRPDPEHGQRRLAGITDAGRKAFHDNGKPLYDELRNPLLEAGFPYQWYLRDTALPAQLLEPSRIRNRRGRAPLPPLATSPSGARARP